MAKNVYFCSAGCGALLDICELQMSILHIHLEFKIYSRTSYIQSVVRAHTRHFDIKMYGQNEPTIQWRGFTTRQDQGVVETATHVHVTIVSHFKDNY